MPADDLPRLPPRDPSGHKGTFGTVAVVGGCCTGGKAMLGAPALAALGALRAGAGLAKLVMPEPILPAALSICPSATGIVLPVGSEGCLLAGEAPGVLDRVVGDAHALVIGPGLGDDPAAKALCLRAVQQESIPVIVDADAINALASVPELFRDFRARAVLTPHPGEFRRLAVGLGISLDPTVPGSRPGAAEALAQRLGCIVVLKGAGTIVSDGHRTWTCQRGHACLGTAGTGDVLGGVIAALASQFSRDGDTGGPGPSRAGGPLPGRLSLFDAARVGVQAHAVAGELWARRHASQAGLLASELAELIPETLESMRSPGAQQPAS